MFLEKLRNGFVTKSVDECIDVAKRFANFCDNECVIGLYGDLGVGKTAFVKGLGMAWNIDDVKSPSFNIVDVHHGIRTLIHVDAYRINQRYNLADINDFIVPPFCIAIEWPENLSNINYTYKLNLSIDSENTHKITLL